MSENPVTHDERTFAVADTSYRFAYSVLAFGVLLAAAARGLFFREACWELLGLVVVSSAVASVYQRVKQVRVLPPRRWLWISLLSAVVAVAIGLAMAFAVGGKR